MEELQKRHRQEQKDLQSRITQKKKAATKKTRKGVNDECAELERQLQQKQETERSQHEGAEPAGISSEQDTPINGLEDSSFARDPDITVPLKSLSISAQVPTTNGQTKKPNRQKARLARRAEEQAAVAEQAQNEATHLPNLREQERQSMLKAFTSRGLKEHEIRSDGHCLYAAIADQLQDRQMSLKPETNLPEFESNDYETSPYHAYKLTRQVAAAYISQNSDDFVSFLEEPLDVYVNTIKETGEWGGHLEILALAKAYGVDFNVLQGDGNIQKIECGLEQDHPELWLAYYRHSFGLGEHYNSLRKAG